MTAAHSVRAVWHSGAIGAIMGGLDWPSALIALGMDWTEDGTMKTTVNDISNITFIKL